MKGRKVKAEEYGTQGWTMHFMFALTFLKTTVSRNEFSTASKRELLSRVEKISETEA
jgi:hypothetical protein